MKEPALRLMVVIDNEADQTFTAWIISELSERGLDHVAQSPEVQRRADALMSDHLAVIDTIRRRAHYSRGVVYFDIVDDGIGCFNKFIPYHLFPDASYAVALTRTPLRTKISVGSNPWSPRPCAYNIATLCERYGGGGHAVVGAISLGPSEIESARAAAREIVGELSHESSVSSENGVG